MTDTRASSRGYSAGILHPAIEQALRLANEHGVHATFVRGAIRTQGVTLSPSAALHAFASAHRDGRAPTVEELQRACTAHAARRSQPTCPKCGGGGWLGQFKTVDGGRCWACAGAGTVLHTAQDTRGHHATRG